MPDLNEQKLKDIKSLISCVSGDLELLKEFVKVLKATRGFSPKATEHAQTMIDMLNESIKLQNAILIEVKARYES